MATPKITAAMPAALAKKMDKMLLANERPADIVEWLKDHGHTVGLSTLYFRRADLRRHRTFRNKAKATTSCGEKSSTPGETPQDIETASTRQKRRALTGFDEYWAARFEAFKASLPKPCICGQTEGVNKQGFCPKCWKTAAFAFENAAGEVAA